MNRIQSTISLLLMAAFLSISAPGFAQDAALKGNKRTREALKKLTPLRAEGLIVSWRGKRVNPTRVAGFRWAAPEGMVGLVAAEAFLKEFQDLLSAPVGSLELARTESTRGRMVFRFGQRFDGLEVLGAEVVVQTDGQGNVLSMVDESVRFQLAPVSDIGYAKAVAAAWMDVNGQEPRIAIPEGPESSAFARKAVLARGGTPRLVYRVLVPTIPMLSKVICLVDGETGEVVQKTNEVIR
jgi:hypothetical protein